MIISIAQQSSYGTLTAGSGFSTIVQGVATTEYKLAYSPVTNFQVTFGDSATWYWEQIGDAIQAPVQGTFAGSGNWAGYEIATNANHNSIVNEAFTQFYQPFASYPPLGCADFYTCVFSTWVGLEDSEGASDGNLAQDGTSATCVNSGCSASYTGWYEMLPNASVSCGSGFSVRGGDEILDYTENEAGYGGSNTKYDFYVYDYQTGTWCWSPGNSYSLPTPHFADFIHENDKLCFIDCASLASFANVNFLGANLIVGNGSPTYIYDYYVQGFSAGWYMTNGPCYSNCGSSTPSCGTGITNVSTSSVSPASAFTETWVSSQYTPYYNTHC